MFCHLLLFLQHVYIKDLQLSSLHEVVVQCLSMCNIFRIDDLMTDVPPVENDCEYFELL